MQETQVQSLGRKDPLEKEMATHLSILAWEIPWTEEPDGLQSMVARVRHNLVTKPSPSLHSVFFIQLKNPPLLRPVTRQDIKKKTHTSEKTFVFGNTREVRKHFLLLLEYTWFTMLC